MRNVINILTLLFIILVSSGFCYGQEELSFDEMWELTTENNPDLKNASLQVERVKRLKRSSWDPGMTSVDLNRGQINSALIDNQWTIEQEIGSPFEMAATNRYYETEIGLVSDQYELTNRSLKKQLRNYYYEWLYENERQRTIEEALNLYQKASEFAELQFETGESNLLSKALIDSRFQEMSLLFDRILVNKENLANQINLVVNAEIDVLPEQEDLERLVLPGNNVTFSDRLDSIPEISIEKQRLAVAQSYLGLTRSKISPYFKAGYFNQQLDLVSGFDGWLIGVAFPLWFFPQKARIQAASIDLSIAENAYRYRRQRIENEYRNILNRINLLTDNLEFYDDQRIRNAEMIIKNANAMYEAGEIGYLEFVQNVNTAIQIREDYLGLINEYNQLVIDVYYYLDI